MLKSRLKIYNTGEPERPLLYVFIVVQ